MKTHTCTVHRNTLTNTHTHVGFVCYISVCMRVYQGPTEQDTLLDAGKSETERDICQSLNGIFPMQLIRCSPSLCLTHDYTHTHTYIPGRAQVRKLCLFECQYFNGVLILYKKESGKQIPQHVAACWSKSLSSSFSIKVCLCDLWCNEM